MLKLNHLCKNYGKVEALRDVNMTFGEGIYALLGPNGSGKSTMMNLIVGLLSPTSGDVLFNDAPIKSLGKEYLGKIGYMPQYPGMYPSFTVFDFLLYLSELKELPRGNEAEISYLLERVELLDCADRKISTLSGGMKQRLALVGAVLGYPSIIVLDEPTAGLDPKQRIAVRNFVAEIAAKRTVIWATHIVSDIEGTAKEVVMLKKGEIVDIAPPADLAAKMQGKVFEVFCTPDEADILKKKYRISGTVAENGGFRLRVLADEKPAENATVATPTLEDYYLFVFGEIL